MRVRILYSVTMIIKERITNVGAWFHALLVVEINMLRGMIKSDECQLEEKV